MKSSKRNIYFDNSATSLTPAVVLKAVQRYYKDYCVNIERSGYRLALKASKEYESGRFKAAKYLLHCHPEEFIFTRNFTEGANLAAYALEHPLLDRGNSKDFSFGEKLICWHSSDNIVGTVMEHHSNFMPWMRLARHKGLKMKYVYPTPEGILTPEAFSRIVDKNTKLVAFQHVSNAFGVLQPAQQIIAAIKKANPEALIFVDGAQAAGHIAVNFKELGCDFYGFSGHKGPLGPKGTGGLVVKKKLLGLFHPFLIGGGTVLDVTLDDYKLKDEFQRFDGGTPNIPGLIGLGTAAEYLGKRIGVNKVAAMERLLIKKLLNGLRNIEGVEIYGPKRIYRRTGIVAFNLKGWLCHDVSLALDEKWGILTRAGHHCCLPAMRFFNLLEPYGGSVRVSLHHYNTAKEVDIFLGAIKELVK